MLNTQNQLHQKSIINPQAYTMNQELKSREGIQLTRARAEKHLKYLLPGFSLLQEIHLAAFLPHLHITGGS